MHQVVPRYLQNALKINPNKINNLAHVHSSKTMQICRLLTKFLEVEHLCWYDSFIVSNTGGLNRQQTMKYVQYTNIVTGQIIEFDESNDGTVIEAGSPEFIETLRYANGNDEGEWTCTEFMVS